MVKVFHQHVSFIPDSRGKRHPNGNVLISCAHNTSYSIAKHAENNTQSPSMGFGGKVGIPSKWMGLFHGKSHL